MSSPQQTPPPIIYALSGSAALVVADAILYPIDRIRAKLQTQSKRSTPLTTQISGDDDTYYTSFPDAVRKIIRHEGISGLYVGLPGSSLQCALAGFAFNYFHSSLRQAYQSARLTSISLPQPPGTPAELAFAYLAGCATIMAVTPISLVTTRQQTAGVGESRKRKGMLETAREVLGEEQGVRGFWRGAGVAWVLSINPGITYGAIERLRAVLFGGREVLRPWESACEYRFRRLLEAERKNGQEADDGAVIGVVSKAIAIVLLQPVSVASVGMKAKLPANRNGKPFRSFWDVIAHTMETEGFVRLYKGLGAALAKAMLLQGILQILKERCVQSVNPVGYSAY
jgi:hypothetical protein